jgi:hypothetical protein
VIRQPHATWAILAYTVGMRGVLGLVVVVAACGGGSNTPAPPDTSMPSIDAPVAPMPDAPTTFAACAAFGGAGMHLPAHVNGTLGSADITAPTDCPGDSPFGIATAGPDSVVRIDGLTVGTTYSVRLVAESDLSFYVVTGCSTATGPSSAQCVLFEDAQKAGIDETGQFVATQATEYIVVDYFASSPPANTAFTLDVNAETCSDGAGCPIDSPVCFDGHCVECESSFDCPNAEKSTCNTAMHACEPGVSSCTSDDANAPNDDGPAGAPVISLDGTGRGSVNGLICSSPKTESDYIAFDVATVGETWDFLLAWSGQADLDLEIDDNTGEALGLSYYEHPETVRVTYLRPGRYYARVTEFSSTANPAPIAYALNALRSAGTGCQSAADCASVYRNQVFRGDCVAGSCIDIVGNGAVTEGGHCDSQNDCATGLSCPSFYFVDSADTRETCERTCTSDTDCAPLGGGFVCTTYVTTNFCIRKCVDDDDCPTSLDNVPNSGPWYRLSCNQSTGRCAP